MGKGRKPLPTKLKLLRGNPGKRRLNDREPNLGPALPKCPPHLDTEAKNHWRLLLKDLKQSGILATVDRGALAMLCEAWSRYAKMAALVREHGEALLHNGRLYTSPYYLAMTKERAAYHRIASEFGLTPSSRTRLAITPQGPVDAFEEFLQSG